MSLFAPLAEIPGEHQTRSNLGERRLWAAVLQDGINVLLGNTPAHEIDKRSTERWFNRMPCDEVPYFEGVCYAVGLEPSAVKMLVRRTLEERERPRRAAWMSSRSKYGGF